MFAAEQTQRVNNGIMSMRPVALASRQVGVGDLLRPDPLPHLVASGDCHEKELIQLSRTFKRFLT